LRLRAQRRVEPLGALERAREMRGVLLLSDGRGNTPEEQRADE
jgi:hypothetical protein